MLVYDRDARVVAMLLDCQGSPSIAGKNKNTTSNVVTFETSSNTFAPHNHLIYLSLNHTHAYDVFYQAAIH